MTRTGRDPLTLPLIELASEGRRPRCSDPGDRGLWVSEDADERAVAAGWCGGCRVLAACRESAERHGESFGVWAGVDRTGWKPQKPRKGKHPTERRIMTDNPNPSRAPRDVVPPSGLTRETVLNLSAAIGKPVTFSEPGALIADLDGTPLAVEPPIETTAILGGFTLSRAQLADLGLTPEDVPNVRIV